MINCSAAEKCIVGLGEKGKGVIIQKPKRNGKERKESSCLFKFLSITLNGGKKMEIEFTFSIKITLTNLFNETQHEIRRFSHLCEKMCILAISARILPR